MPLILNKEIMYLGWASIYKLSLEFLPKIVIAKPQRQNNLVDLLQ